MAVVAECKLDIVIVVDCSGSITDHPNGPDSWALIVDFIINIIRGLEISETGSHVAIVTFGKTFLSYLFSFQCMQCNIFPTTCVMLFRLIDSRKRCFGVRIFLQLYEQRFAHR